MRLVAIHGLNGALLLGAGLYAGALVVWLGCRAFVLNPPQAPRRRSTLMDQPHRGPECRW